MVVRPDQVSLGVLVTAVGRDAVDGAVAACGVADRRAGGKLPAHVVAYLTMGLCLFAEDDYEEVATKVTGALNRWGCWDAVWSGADLGGITQARKRLGPAVLAEVFERVAQPVGGLLTRVRGCGGGGYWPSMGSRWTCPTPRPMPPSSGIPGRGNRSAFPNARVVALEDAHSPVHRQGISDRR